MNGSLRPVLGIRLLDHEGPENSQGESCANRVEVPGTGHMHERAGSHLCAERAVKVVRHFVADVVAGVR